MDKDEIFKNKGGIAHNGKYNYSKVNYKNSKTKVKIICPEHGEFEQSPEKHINRKQGCPKCSSNYKLTKEYVINKSTKIHNNKYDYTKVVYKSALSDIKIICPEHGEFEQRCSVHMDGGGCPKCVGKNKINSDVIISLNEVHDNKYDYSKVNYKNGSTPLKIICKVHGEFKQTYNTHKKGHGCPKCVGRYKTTKDYIKECYQIHGNKYDYRLVNYVNSVNKIKIICKLHGEFKQSPTSHLNGSGCPKCKGLNITTKKTKTLSEFINESNLVHKNTYNYSKVDYVNCKNYVTIICNTHGEFNQTPDSHIQGNGCPKCALKYDKLENEVKEFINSLNLQPTYNSRSVIPPLELDIYIPSKEIAIEFDGLYWHSELYKPSNYHLNKTELCEKQNIQLIHIFEDEWVENEDIVKSRLKNILGLTNNRIYGRKCIIKEVSTLEARIFSNSNHLQGYANSSIKLGLYYNDELVSLMLFSKPRLGIGTTYDGYELTRFCNKINTTVIGGASKLLKYFINRYSPKEIKSYADRRWSDGGLYKTLGFEEIKHNKPNYWYIINNSRKHRFSFRKTKLKTMGYDIKNKTEKEIMFLEKKYRIYDCGTITYKKTP